MVTPLHFLSAPVAESPLAMTLMSVLFLSAPAAESPSTVTLMSALFLALFFLVFVFRYLRTVVSIHSWNTYKPKPIPEPNPNPNPSAMTSMSAIFLALVDTGVKGRRKTRGIFRGGRRCCWRRNLRRLRHALFFLVFVFRYLRRVVSIYSWNTYKPKSILKSPTYTSADVSVVILALFFLVFIFRYLRTVVSIHLWTTYKPKPIPKNPTYTSADVSVIIPTAFKQPVAWVLKMRQFDRGHWEHFARNFAVGAARAGELLEPPLGMRSKHAVSGIALQ
ncbi:Hypothetical predicted protein [Lecanosticta acicola]|uniref:Uncharacterized protein n=1 Tax=Lecanosticta acicola TaxID=111012 RepID=A0AAI8Z2I6_9PEZI|nr:Hypothetical predicted protein [Lecanosticta acicola]